jgi:hypothetical protein
MSRFIIVLFSAALAFSADDPWGKVKDLKSGTEIRIYKVGAKQALIAKLDEANDERILIATKTEQVAIPKEQIDRLDARPNKGSRVRNESKTKTEVDTHTADATVPHGPAGLNTSTSSGISVGSKPDFEVVYRRVAAAK